MFYTPQVLSFKSNFLNFAAQIAAQILPFNNVFYISTSVWVLHTQNAVVWSKMTICFAQLVIFYKY